jgi:hypothetical protein
MSHEPRDRGTFCRFVLALDDSQAPAAIAGAVCFEYSIAR